LCQCRLLSLEGEQPRLALEQLRQELELQEQEQLQLALKRELQELEQQVSAEAALEAAEAELATQGRYYETAEKHRLNFRKPF